MILSLPDCASNRPSVRSFRWCCVLVVVLSMGAVPVPAQSNCTTLFCDNPSTLEGSADGNVAGDTNGLSRCFFGSIGKYCEPPVLLGVGYSLDDFLCDPYGATPCAITAESQWHFPGNGSNDCLQGFTINAGWLLDDSFCGLSFSGTL